MEALVDWVGKVLGAVFGTQNERILKQYWKVVRERINPLEEGMKGLSAEEFPKLTEKLRKHFAEGGGFDEVLPEAFAACREAGRRTVEMRHFDVQLIGGMVLHEGKIAEMVTGEGKTLVATLSAYLNACTGKGVHIVTVNDYLARRDTQWMGPIYHYLGVSVGCLNHEASYLYDPTHDDDPESRLRHLFPCGKKEAYGADITYGTNNEYGFDYLRDNMKVRLADQVQRSNYFAIVDEVDSILIDEARTPHIISGPAEQSADKYFTADRVSKSLQRGEEIVNPDRSKTYTGDFIVKEKEHMVILTEPGVEKAERLVGVDTFYSGENMDWPHYIETALKAHNLYRLDRDYVVKDGEVIIVDEFTGRMMPGRRWSDGLHQAVEAKEKMRIQEESQTYATVTLQHYFKMYDKLAGMTGTAATEAMEFEKIYGCEVVVIPTNKTLIRNQHPDSILGTEREKFEAAEEEIARVHATGRPILVGTTSIEKSEILSRMLKMRGIKHEVLNAKQHEREAHIVANAGQSGSVTIATNMAGRGTDIILGGGVAERGGLHIVGTERHEARRIDNQLRGRAGRQGDPGSSRFFLSLEDDLFRKFAPPWMKGIMQKLGLRAGEAIESKLVTRAITKAQKNVEARNFEIRKSLVEYDLVRNEQRKVIYELRQEVLEGEELREKALGFFRKRIRKAVDQFLPPRGRAEWDYSGLAEWHRSKFGEAPPFRLEEVKDPGAVEEKLVAHMEELYAKRENIVGMKDLRRQVKRLAEWAFQDEGIREKTLNDLCGRLKSDFNVEIALNEIAAGDGDAIVTKAADRIAALLPQEVEKIGHEMMRAGERYVLLSKIDEKWKDLLYNMDQLRDIIGLRGFAQMDPKQEFKREGMSLFQGTMDAIEEDVTSLLFRIQQVAVDDDRLAQRWRATQYRKDEFEAFSAGGAEEEEGGNGKPRPIVSQKRPGRNDPCYCGSGKKYKKCCLHKDDARDASENRSSE
ncbi:MAG: preprotein translocase subunit SecA [Planctomycetota bacterium]|jgi:preprotein translocase subunit SecA